MKRSVKKIAVGFTLSIASLTLFSFTSGDSAESKATVGAGGPTITCPAGDWYKCYQFPNGGIVYKGQDGDTTIQF
jgi:hypothetical protein